MTRFYHTNTDAAASGQAYTFEKRCSSTHTPADDGASVHTDSIPNLATQRQSFMYWSDDEQPHNDLNWPTTGYGVSVDVSAAGAALTYDLRLMRVFVSTGILQLSTTPLAGQSGTGIKTSTGVAWNANAAGTRGETDRISLGVRVSSANEHGGAQSISVLYSDSDSWVENTNFTPPPPEQFITPAPVTVNVTPGAMVIGDKNTAATLVSYTETAWSAPSSKSTASISWDEDDLIYVVAAGNSSIAAPTATGLTFNLSRTAQEGEVPFYLVRSWWARAGSSGSGAVSSSGGAGGIAVYVFRNSDGVGNGNALYSGIGGGTTFTPITRSYSYSRVVNIIADLAAGAVTGTWSPSGETEREASQVSGEYTIFLADWDDQGGPGSTSYGGRGATPVARIAEEILGYISTGPETQNIVPAAETIDVTPGTLTITPGAVDITPAAETINVTPGSLTVVAVPPGQSITPAPVTIDVAPGSLVITVGAVDITPAPVTIDVAPGSLSITTEAFITPAPVTIDVTPGGLSITTEAFITPAAETITVTPGTLTVATAAGPQDITPAPLTIDVAPGGLTITTEAFVVPEPVTIDVTPGGLTITTGAVDIVPDPLTVSVTPGTLTVSAGVSFITPEPVTIDVTPGGLTITTSVGLTPAPVTIDVTPGSLAITTGAVDIVPDPVTVAVTPGGLTIVQGLAIVPAAETITVTPGTLTITTGAVDLTLTGETVTVTPGTLTVTQTTPISLDPVTVDVTPGTLTITVGAAGIAPEPVVITASPGTLAISIGLELDAPTVSVTPGSVDITVGAVDITPDPLTVTVTPGTLTIYFPAGGVVGRLHGAEVGMIGAVQQPAVPGLAGGVN
jgi:hypothetical protein